MSDPNLSALTRRIERLERANRRLRLMGMLGAIVLGAVALMGQAQPPRVSKVVEAEQFLLKDAAGKLRGQWIVQDNGFVALQFISSAQQRRMMLFNATDDSVGLVISNRPGNTVVDLTADSKGDQAGLRLYDYDARRATKPRAAIEVRDSVPVVSLFDGHGRAHAMLRLREQHMEGGVVGWDPELVFRDRTGTEHHLWKAP